MTASTLPCKMESFQFAPLCFCTGIKIAVHQATSAAHTLSCHTWCISQDISPLATTVWRAHSFRWRQFEVVEESLSGKVIRHRCKMFIVQDHSKQLEKCGNMARTKVELWCEKLICSLQCMRSHLSAWESCWRSREEESQRVSLKKTLKSCVYPHEHNSPIAKGYRMVTSHSNISAECLKVVIQASESLVALQLQNARIHSTTSFFVSYSLVINRHSC